MKKCSSTLLALVTLFSAFGITVPLKAQASNYFCKASVQLIPWNAGADAPLPNATTADYAMWLWVDGKSDLKGRVTLITDSKAWSVNVDSPLYEVHGSSDRATRGFHVRFDKAETVRYMFVDAAGVDGAPVTDCPSVVRTVALWKDEHTAPRLPNGAAELTPTLLQPLPKLSCASVYVPAKLARDGSQDVSHYGNGERNTKLLLDIDSNGRIVRSKLYESSGIDGLDTAALAGAQASTFTPATFLCVPVVSEVIWNWDYSPY
jgi:hypothetical protein